MVKKFVVFVMFFTLFAPSAQGGELEEIQRAIKEKGAKWTVGETSVSQLPPAERRRLLGAILEEGEYEEGEGEGEGEGKVGFVTDSLPSKFDWRDYGGYDWTTPIRDQMGCGSCVAFAVVGAFEGDIKVHFNAPQLNIDLSEQYLFSCGRGPGGCDYGWDNSSALNYLKSHGIPDEVCLPYAAVDNNCDQACSDWQMRARGIEEWMGVLGLVEQIKAALLTKGPLATDMSVYTDFMYYTGGVYEQVSTHFEGGHAVAIVGWSDPDSCWTCKNSWGRGWGEEGWFRIKWGECGINSGVKWMTPSLPPYPNLKFASYGVSDTEFGDGDEVLNPGETVDLLVALRNEISWSQADTVTAILRSEDHRVTILDSMGSYGTIQDGDTTSNSGDLFQVSLSESMGVENIPMQLYLEANKGTYATLLEFELNVSWSQRGWPVHLGDVVQSSPLMLDIDGDEQKEVIFGGFDGHLYVKTFDGQDKGGFPFQTGNSIQGSPAAGDVDGNGELDIVTGSWDGKIYCLRANGQLLFSPVSTGSFITATPTLSDLDGNDSLEIIVGSYDKKLYVLKGDGTSLNDNFPYDVGSAVTAGAAVGDIDKDGRKDIVFAAANKVYALSQDGEFLPGWPVQLGGRISSPPSIANLDGSGPKVVVGCEDKKLYVLNPDSTFNLVFSAGGKIKGSPSFVPVEGSLAIAFGASNGLLYLIREDSSLVDGWPVDVGDPIESSPCFSDLDGDSLPELVALSKDGTLYAYSLNGEILPHFPMPAGGIGPSSPAIADLDGDGDLEIAFGHSLGVQVIDYKAKSSQGRYWSMFRGNPCRTGNYADIFTGISEREEERIVPLRYTLYQNYPNPFNPATIIKYNLPQSGTVQLTIYNILGEKVINLVGGYQKAGEKRVRWQANSFPSGIYFCQLKAGGQTITKKLALIK